MASVNVLLSTYNGEKYLVDQIDSILSQKNVEIFLTVRDDGSTDRTLDILKKYQKLSNVDIFFGKNIGFKKSFINLFSRLAKPHCDFYAFSDQDDFWLPEKMNQAVSFLKHEQGPTLYISDRFIANGDLSVISGKVYDNYPAYNWTASHISRLVDSRGAGCVQVWNSSGQYLLNHFQPSQITHDEWVTAVFTFLGKVKYDDRAFIYYRRHSDAVSGTAQVRKHHSVIKKIMIVIQALHHKNFSQDVDTRAQLLLQGYSDLLSDNDRKDLMLFASYKHNFWGKILILLENKIKVTSRSSKKYQLMKILMLLSNGL